MIPGLRFVTLAALVIALISTIAPPEESTLDRSPGTMPINFSVLLYNVGALSGWIAPQPARLRLGN